LAAAWQSTAAVSRRSKWPSAENANWRNSICSRKRGGAPLRAGGELGGHFVTGHIDGVGKIIRWECAGQDYVLDIAAPVEVMRYIVCKGSVAVDGISLTVAGVSKKGFRIWIIPHTFEITALREREVGDAVNLEADLLGKYAEKFFTARRRR